MLVFTKDTQKPQLISDVTAVSPAFDLKVAYDELDGTMKKSPSFSSYIDLLLLEWFNINPDWCGELEPDEDVQQELKNLNGFGFRYLLFQSVKKDLSTRQDKSFWPWNCLNLWDDINFNFYLQNYAPGVTKWLVNKNGEFLKWTEKLHSKKQVNLRILTTEDDYINKANVWDDDQKKNPTHYIVLPDGGHYGMSVYKEYENLLKYEFGDSGCIFPETENYEELNDSPKSRGFTDLN